MDQENHSTRFSRLTSSIFTTYDIPECPYPRPFLSVDIIWNLGFVLLAGALLLTSISERPSTPLRLWVGGYAVQCLSHLAFLWVQHQGDSVNSHPNRFMRALESINTVVSSVWWVFGLCCIYIGGQALLLNSPRLYWLTLFFVAVDVVFMTFRIAMACLVFFLLVCILPMVARVSYALRIGGNGASEGDIRSLPKYIFRQSKTCGATAHHLGRNNSKMPELVLSSEDSECCICLNSYEDGVRLCTLPCNHHFHYQCIGKWLRINAICPLCKCNILQGEMLV